VGSNSDLYGDDIRLWSERQAGLLRRLAAGEAVSEQVDWPHVVDEIEDLGTVTLSGRSRTNRPPDRPPRRRRDIGQKASRPARQSDRQTHRNSGRTDQHPGSGEDSHRARCGSSRGRAGHATSPKLTGEGRGAGRGSGPRGGVTE